MDNLSKRALTGIVLVLVIGLAVYAGQGSFFVLVLAINLISLIEFYRLFYSPTLLPRKSAGLLLSLFMLVSVSLVVSGETNWKILLINIPVAFGVFIAELYLKAENPFPNLAITFLGILCITIPICCFTAIAFLPPGEGIYHYNIILGYFFILWAGDTGAYFTGKYLGRHQLFERISPKKTWEGSLGGMICAVLMAFLNAYLFPDIHTRHWVILSLIVVVTGTFGDLIKSLLKRSLHIKDSGKILPGHGGMLDRFDSMLGSASFVLGYFILFPYA